MEEPVAVSEVLQHGVVEFSRHTGDKELDGVGWGGMGWDPTGTTMRGSVKSALEQL